VRRALAPLLALALLLAPASAADDDTLLPQHFLSDSTAVGDWSTFEARLSFGEPCAERASVPEKIIVTYRVKAVDANGTSVAVETLPPHEREWETRHFKKGSKSLRELLGLGASVELSHVRSEQERRTFDDHEVDATHVTFTTREGELVQRNELWTQPIGMGLRILALSTRVISGPTPRLNLEMELRGYGSADKTMWGRTAEELK
jgi:hypothetical protein